MSNLFSILRRHISMKELDVLENSFDTRSMVINRKEIEKNISPNRARDIASILFVFMDEFNKESEVSARELFVHLNAYYDTSVNSNILIEDGALEPAGMCDLRRNGDYVYESIY